MKTRDGMMLKRTMLLIAAALAFSLGGLLSLPSAGAPQLVGSAHAGATVKVNVDVLHGTKTGKGADSASARHKKVIDQMPQYTTFQHVGSNRQEVAVGKALSASMAGRKVVVSVLSISGEKASLQATITDPAGGKHSSRASVSNGGVFVLSAKSKDSSEVHVFIISVSY